MLRLLRRLSQFLARLPGLPIVVGIGLIVLNFAIQLLPNWPAMEWLSHTDLLLHAGLVLGFVGTLLGDAL